MSGWADGPGAGDDRGQQGAQLGDPHPPQERRADDQDRRRAGAGRTGAAAGVRLRRVPCARWVRSSSQLSQSGVSAIAEGAGTSSRSARSRTSR